MAQLSTGTVLYQSDLAAAPPRWCVTVERHPGGNLPVLVRFTCMGLILPQLSRCALWLPTANGWHLDHWDPKARGSLVPEAVLRAVERRLAAPR